MPLAPKYGGTGVDDLSKLGLAGGGGGGGLVLIKPPGTPYTYFEQFSAPNVSKYNVFIMEFYTVMDIHTSLYTLGIKERKNTADENITGFRRDDRIFCALTYPVYQNTYALYFDINPIPNTSGSPENDTLVLEGPQYALPAQVNINSIYAIM